MADYQPLIQRAVEGLSEPTAAARRQVYERARSALMGQLRGLDPPLSEIDIARERMALDAAIARVEGAFPPEPEPFPEATVPTAAAPSPDVVLPPEAAPHPASRSLEEAVEPPRAVEPSWADEPPPAVRPPPILAASPSADPVPAEGAPQRERPRIAIAAPALGRAGRWRPAILGAGIGIPILGIALVAFLNRPDPAALPQRPTTGEGGVAANGDAKRADRVAGSERPSAPAAAAPPVAPPPSAAPSVPPSAAPAVARHEIPVAQRAVLYEENPAQPQQPRASGGRAVWRLDNVNAGQGQPLETVVRATVEVPDAGLTLALLIRRNTEAALPASHTVELTFSGGGPQGRMVRDVGLLQLKSEEGTRGTPVAGVPVPVRENLFLLGLSNVPADVERNTDLLTRRSWIDLPLRFTTGQRAILSFEKGLSGESVMNEAFRLWR